MKPLDELTAHCIRCGFCLESCPTYLLTGEETESPRGRIYLVRSADEGELEWESIRPHMDRCLGCLACQTACPSGVEYGEIFEIARDKLESSRSHRAKKGLLRVLTDPKRTRISLSLGRMIPGKRIPAALSRLLSGQTPEANRPSRQASHTLPPLEEEGLPPQIGEVYLLEGCVMRVLFPRVHEATRRLLRRIGYGVREADQGCCGSLHLHAGFMSEARARAGQLSARLTDGLPVIVDSAGCGSTMKGYASLFSDAADSRHALAIGTFSERVFDASEFLYAHGLLDALAKAPGLRLRATCHDACHLAHGQSIRSQPRELLRGIPGIEFVELVEADMCCGSAGIYNLAQPRFARALLERKWNNIEKTGASVVAMGNPGCHAWIGQAEEEHGRSVRVLHTMELLEAAFCGLDAFGITDLGAR